MNVKKTICFPPTRDATTSRTSFRTANVDVRPARISEKAQRARKKRKDTSLRKQPNLSSIRVLAERNLLLVGIH